MFISQCIASIHHSLFDTYTNTSIKCKSRHYAIIGLLRVDFWTKHMEDKYCLQSLHCFDCFDMDWHSCERTSITIYNIDHNHAFVPNYKRNMVNRPNFVHNALTLDKWGDRFIFCVRVRVCMCRWQWRLNQSNAICLQKKHGVSIYYSYACNFQQ